MTNHPRRVRQDAAPRRTGPRTVVLAGNLRLARQAVEEERAREDGIEIDARWLYPGRDGRSLDGALISQIVVHESFFIGRNDDWIRIWQLVRWVARKSGWELPVLPEERSAVYTDSK